MNDGDDAATALPRLIGLDPAFATSPRRLERALLDLAPQDERGGRLLSAGAEFGVPGLLGQGHSGEARAVLADRAGMREDVIEWVLASWSAALPGLPPAEPTSSPAPPTRTAPRAAPAEAPPPDRPGVPSAIRVALWPDGMPLVAVLTTSGVFVATSGPAGWSQWRRVATPSAPTSRDVAVSVRGDGDPGVAMEAVVAWSERAGVFRRGVRRDGVDRLSLAEPEVVATPEPGTEPRHPVAVLCSDDGVLDVIWTVDRTTLWHRTVRPGLSARGPGRLPEPCSPGDHLRGLDAAVEDGRRGWLVALTGRRGAVLTEWDLVRNDVPPWRPVPGGRPLVSVTVLALRSGSLLVGLTAGGELLARPAASAMNDTGEWRHLDRPVEAAEIGRPHAVAGAGDGSDQGWLALVGARGGWLAPVLGGSNAHSLGAPIALPLA